MKYKHVVYYSEKDGKTFLVVDRLFESGRHDFCTHYELPNVRNEKEGFELMGKVSEWLGNTLCIDNPEFRAHIKIETESKEPGSVS
ncbi:MAG TPA: hypothetical protein VLB06_01790 [Sulfuricaulis sp.]|nr:hypothetical protein [Sulfuricaulis sp.]